MCGETRCEDWYVDDRAMAEPKRSPHPLQHVAVGEHVRTGEVDLSVARHVHRAHEGADSIRKCDRLAAVADPARSHHDGEPPNEVAHDLE